MSATISEGYRSGCIGRIAQLHSTYYAATHGFDVGFEAKVAQELGQFCTSYENGRDGLWLATDEDIEGSIAIDGAHASEEGAHLRWFIISDALRGQGIGRQLLSRAIEFVDACNYKRTYLWTFNGLLAARHLYESCGFRLTHENIGTQWGSAVLEQKFVRQN